MSCIIARTKVKARCEVGGGGRDPASRRTVMKVVEVRRIRRETKT